MRKILGLDIGGGCAVAFLLQTDKLENIRDYVKGADFCPFEVKLTHENLSTLVELNPDVVIFEPTGDHYEQVFVHWFDRYNIPYKRAVGRRVASFRNDKGLPKTDGIDAFALALYGYIKLDPTHPDYDPKAFVPPCELTELREWWLQRHGAVRRRARLVARFRQELSKCIPEARETKLSREWGDQPRPLLLWLSGKLETGNGASFWKNLVYGGVVKRQKKVTLPGTCGLGVTPGLKAFASELLQLDELLYTLETQINDLLAEERFSGYMRAFERVGGSKNMISVYMTRIYPFSRFMGEDGKPITLQKPSKETGKICTYDLSLAQFKAALGAGTRENTSGTRQKRSSEKPRQKNWRGRNADQSGQKAEIAMGDRFSRKAFFLWGNPQIEGTRGKLTKNPDAQVNCDPQLITHSEKLGGKSRNLFQRLGNLQGHHAKLLYRALKKELQQ